MSEYIPVLAMVVLSALVPGLFLAVSALFGPRRPSAVKGEAFECGNLSSGPAWGRFSVKFYLTAILFIVFDVEVVFLYPWALLFRRLAVFGFVEMMIFISVLAFGLVYVLVFGPLNIWLLRRLRRTVRAWLFMPAVAVIMAAMCAMRSSDTVPARRAMASSALFSSLSFCRVS